MSQVPGKARTSVVYGPTVAAIPSAIPPRNQSFVQSAYLDAPDIGEMELSQISKNKSAKAACQTSFRKFEAELSYDNACAP